MLCGCKCFLCRCCNGFCCVSKCYDCVWCVIMFVLLCTKCIVMLVLCCCIVMFVLLCACRCRTSYNRCRTSFKECLTRSLGEISFFEQSCWMRNCQCLPVVDKVQITLAFWPNYITMYITIWYLKRHWYNLDVILLKMCAHTVCKCYMPHTCNSIFF